VIPTRDVAAVQRFYPQIYLACHTKHHRRNSNEARLTEHESSILAHLSARHPMRASELARHLGVGASTMSAAIKRLTALGYIARQSDDRDRRASALRLSKQGERAMMAGSILETGRVTALLEILTPAERAHAIRGLQLLADAARQLPRKESYGQ
jgi:DNA-binding MarR family transcriptional regulator